jgi:hypothetical protein
LNKNNQMETYQPEETQTNIIKNLNTTIIQVTPSLNNTQNHN